MGVLGSPFTAGLTHVQNRRLLKCDGHRIRNLTHLARMLDSESHDDYVRFELDEDDLVALPRNAARDATTHILQKNLIPSARSLPSVGPGEADDVPPGISEEAPEGDTRHE